MSVPKWLRWIGPELVQKHLTWDVILPAISKSLGAFSAGSKSPNGAVQPLRSAIDVSNNDGLVNSFLYLHF